VHPVPREPDVTVPELGIRHEDLTIPAGDHDLLGWLLCPVDPGDRPLVMLAHGWGANYGTLLQLAEPLVAAIEARLSGPSSAPSTIDAAWLEPELDRLESLLENGEFAAIARFRELQDALQGPLGPGSRRLRGLLQRFEFAQALQVLRQLRAAQRESHGVRA